MTDGKVAKLNNARTERNAEDLASTGMAESIEMII